MDIFQKVGAKLQIILIFFTVLLPKSEEGGWGTGNVNPAAALSWGQPSILK